MSFRADWTDRELPSGRSGRNDEPRFLQRGIVAGGVLRASLRWRGPPYLNSTALAAAMLSCGRGPPPALADWQVTASNVPSQASSETASSAPKVAARTPSSNGAADASPADAPHDASAPPAPFSLAAWLTEHAMAPVDRDTACTLPARLALEGSCDCDEGLTLTSDPPVDLLVCRRTVLRGSPLDHVTHTLLYAADHGRLRLVLNVPTEAETDIERLPGPGLSDERNSDWLLGNNVHLGVRADGDRVSVFDKGDGPFSRVLDPRYTCEATISRVGRPDLTGDPSFSAPDVAAVKRTYRAVCDAVGVWRWNGTTLVRVHPLSH